METSRYTEIVEKYSDLILRVAWLHVKNIHDAEDCCQNAFIKLLNCKIEFVDESHTKAWLIKVVKNEGTNIFRNLWRKKVVLREEMQDYPEDNSPDELLKIVASINKKYSTLMYLHYYEGYKVLELTQIFSMNENTVKTRLRRGREELKALLEKEGIKNA